MTPEEEAQDGMCIRCAELIWDSMQTLKPFFYKAANTREFK